MSRCPKPDVQICTDPARIEAKVRNRILAVMGKQNAATEYDRIILEQNVASLYVTSQIMPNGKKNVQTFDLKSFDDPVIVDLFSGNDELIIGEHVTRVVKVNGHGGADRIIAHNKARKIIFAGSGNDTVYAPHGANLIYGQGGKDSLDASGKVVEGSERIERDATAEEKAIIARINAWRKKLNLPLSKEDKTLNTAAAWAATQVAEEYRKYGAAGLLHRIWGQERPNHESRAAEAGFEERYTVNEVVPRHPVGATAQQIVDLWMTDPAWAPGYATKVKQKNYTALGCRIVRLDSAYKLVVVTWSMPEVAK